MRDTTELSNKDLKKSIFNDVMFFSLAESGAMGEPGGVFFFDKKGQTYHFNYVLGDADMGKVEKLFPVLDECEFGMFGLDSRVPDCWNYVNLVSFIDKLKNDSIGEWIIDKENDGSMEHPIQMPFVVYSSVVRGFVMVL